MKPRSFLDLTLDENPSITLSQLRDTQRLKAWLRAGKTVELRERNRVIAHIVPVKHGGKTK
jgi:antitoxin (DNA-binding transcriptional repressor) of toxin-antitoxin stability system